MFHPLNHPSGALPVPSFQFANLSNTLVQPHISEDVFEELRLPKFKEAEHNDDELRYSSQTGPGSWHRALTMPPGLQEWFSKDRFQGPYPNPPEIKGAIIHCQGVIERNKVKPFTSIIVASIEATLHSQDTPCSIPSLIGLPVWMRTYRHDPTINRANPIATWLHVIGDLAAEGFGFTAKTVLDSTVVMRNDGKELLPRHLEVLCFFCKHVFQEVLEGNVGNVGLSETPQTREMQKKTFRKLACRKGFLEFYKSYCMERGAQDERWMNLPSPYDMDALDGEAVLDGVEQKVKDPGSAMEDAGGRRTSGRRTRVTQKALDGAESSSPVAGDEARGRTRKRRRPTEGEV